MKTLQMNQKADYGNWVPAAMMKTLWTATAAIAIVTVLMFVLIKSPVPGVIGTVVTLAALCMTLYMQRCRKLFDFRGGGVMGQIHQFLADHFPWKEAVGEKETGRIIDIGCGAAALTNRIARIYPSAEIIGVDFWGKEWSYAKEQCEKNAALEGVADRVGFQKGDAARLDFADGAFDGAVSNFVFHEVRSAEVKRDVVKEALRVVRKGGAFAFQDMFGQKALYGDMEAFCEELLRSGTVKEIHYIPNIEKQPFVPGFVTAPWMIRNAGLIYGIR